MRHLLIFVWLLFVLLNSKAQTQKMTPDQTVKKNSVYYEIFGNGLWHSINYDRVLPFNAKSGLVLRGGLSYYNKLFPLGEINYITGNQAHHFETGFGYTAFHEGHLVFIRTGYRLHGKKGFVFRTAPMFCPTESFLWFGFSFGYCF